MRHADGILRFALFLFLLFSFEGTTFGHEEGAPFSGAIIDPLRVHHAHIEDEQRVNLFSLQGFRLDSGGKGTAFENNFELGVDWTGKFRFGSEIVIPFSNAGFDTDSYNIGDIEVWPLKYALINSAETIFTAVLGFRLPTGSEKNGIGKGETASSILLFFDHAYRNWYFGLNTEVERIIGSGNGTNLELASVTSYSFINQTGQGMAPTKPEQTIVPSVSLEVISESVLSGPEEGENLISILPGFNLWHPKTGFALRLGVEFPISADRENDFAVLLQFGTHKSWKKLGRGSLNVGTAKP